MPRYAVYVLSRPALPLARSLGNELDASIHAPSRFAEAGIHGFDSLRELLETTFARFDGHVFIAAAGIVVRTIAPLLGSKDSDPAVVAMDPEGRFVISLLSGHLGGANELARRCAKTTGGTPVITTATDSAGVVSMDMLASERGLHIADLGEVKAINAALLEGRAVRVYDPLGCLGELDAAAFRRVDRPEDLAREEPGVWVYWREGAPGPGLLRLRPPVLTLGVGCRRGTPREEILGLILRVLEENGLARESVAAMGTADIKRDEQGILEAARELGLPLKFYTAEELAAVAAPTPSSMVERHVGTPGVCEAAALLLGEGGELLVAKQKTERVTVAVARRKTCS
ncbi:cobalt-precorrin 5A hydrolase [Salidesulfovibrio onnuriiensis]|uniref:cobalt-precorrin 5A hydrolase n=1 Tax=Salidesulfovibrio onnuriiensis TaxID=2583823 RepID=UPI0011CAC7CE|nr:cobalt-precorrin 5A hydrolase [Salidesulfovibrio onnuriiensis]